MPTLTDKMREYAVTHQVPFDDDDWDQMCGNLMHRFGTWLGWVTWPSGDISSARRVAALSGPLNKDASKAPAGAWHFYDIAGWANGHVMQDGPGGGHTCFNATWSLFEDLGEAIGFQSVPGYLDAKRGRATYLGWATNYAGGTINPHWSSTAGSGTPLNLMGDDDMKHIYHPERGYAIIGFEGAYGYGTDNLSTAIDAIAARGITSSIVYTHAWEWDTDVREANLRGDALRALQTAHTLAALKAAGLPVDVDEATLAKQLAGLLPTPTVDSIKIAKATADEIDARDRARLGK